MNSETKEKYKEIAKDLVDKGGAGFQGLRHHD